MKYFTPSKLSENIHETPEGYLLCLGVPIARTGEMLYTEDETPLDGDESGLVRITRDEKEVFSPKTMASFEGKPVTIAHPEDFVNPKNWKRLAVGTIQNVRRGEADQKEDLIADLLITDADGINLVKNGLREVSCGYEADYTQTDEGEGVQTSIIGNHLALVQQGRAGSSYAIRDHKRKGLKMKLKDKIKAIFADAESEALKAADEFPEKKDDKEKDKDDAPSKDAMAYDDLVKMVKDFGAKLDKMVGAKDADLEVKAGKEGAVDEEAEMEAKDDDQVEASIEDRMKALEDKVSKLLEMEASEGEEMGDEDMESEDEDMEESEDDNESVATSAMSGDTASRVEILAPGLKASKDVKVKALKAAYGTKDGKKAIEAFTGGKAPKYDSQKTIDTLFIGASELLKIERKSQFSKAKQTRDSDLTPAPKAMTAEQINEINAKHYSKK